MSPTKPSPARPPLPSVRRSGRSCSRGGQPKGHPRTARHERALADPSRTSWHTEGHNRPNRAPTVTRRRMDHRPSTAEQRRRRHQVAGYQGAGQSGRQGARVPSLGGVRLVGQSCVWRPSMAGDTPVHFHRAVTEFDGDELVAFEGRAELEGQVIEEFPVVYGDDDLAVVLLRK